MYVHARAHTLTRIHTYSCKLWRALLLNFGVFNFYCSIFGVVFAFGDTVPYLNDTIRSFHFSVNILLKLPTSDLLESVQGIFLYTLRFSLRLVLFAKTVVCVKHGLILYYFNVFLIQSVLFFCKRKCNSFPHLWFLCCVVYSTLCACFLLGEANLLGCVLCFTLTHTRGLWQN